MQLIFEVNGSGHLALSHDEERPERSLLDIARGLAIEKMVPLGDVSLRFVDVDRRTFASEVIF